MRRRHVGGAASYFQSHQPSMEPYRLHAHGHRRRSNDGRLRPGLSCKTAVAGLTKSLPSLIPSALTGRFPCAAPPKILLPLVAQPPSRQSAIWKSLIAQYRAADAIALLSSAIVISPLRQNSINWIEDKCMSLRTMATAISATHRALKDIFRARELFARALLAPANSAGPEIPRNEGMATTLLVRGIPENLIVSPLYLLKLEYDVSDNSIASHHVFASFYLL